MRIRKSHNLCWTDAWFPLKTGRSFCVSKSNIEVEERSTFCDNIGGYLADIKENEWKEIADVLITSGLDSHIQTSGKTPLK